MTERCPKCGETERHYWCRCGTLIEGTVCPMCDRTREEAMEREHADDSIPFACGTKITPDVRVIRDGEKCLRRQLAQAQEELHQALAREVRLRRVVEEFTDFAEHGGRFVIRPMAETITVNGVVYTPIQWVYDYLEIIDHQIRLQAERVLALLDGEEQLGGHAPRQSAREEGRE